MPNKELIMEQFVNVTQLAQHLDVKESWIYEKSRLRLIPSRKIGKYLRFRISEVERALESEQSSLTTKSQKKRRP